MILQSAVHTEVFLRKDGAFFMKKRTICLLSILLALAVTAAWTAADAHGTQVGLAGKLIRLHVVANSDSEADQAVKLLVRDAVLERAEAQLADCAAMAEAEARLAELLPELEEAAAAILAREGLPYSVRASLGWEQFPTREYDTFTLPAGRYLSLRLTLGEGTGQNWWCVVFPPLCMSATTEEFSGGAQAAGLTDEEIALVTQESEGCVVRFKIIELVEEWIGALG